MTAIREYTPKPVTSACVTCGVEFTYTYTVGMRRKHCSTDCREQYKASRRPLIESRYPPCSVDGCESPACRVSAGLCEKHYGRKRRGVPLDAEPEFAYRYKTGAGYVVLGNSKHPLAKGIDARVHEHRVVAFDSHAGVCPGCFWCGVALDWERAVIDHLDENKENNTPSNLVVACSPCNRARGAMLPFIKRMTDSAFQTFIAQASKYRAA